MNSYRASHVVEKNFQGLWVHYLGHTRKPGANSWICTFQLLLITEMAISIESFHQGVFGRRSWRYTTPRDCSLASRFFWYFVVFQRSSQRPDGFVYPNYHRNRYHQIHVRSEARFFSISYSLMLFSANRPPISFQYRCILTEPLRPPWKNFKVFESCYGGFVYPNYDCNRYHQIHVRSEARFFSISYSLMLFSANRPPISFQYRCILTEPLRPPWKNFKVFESCYGGFDCETTA
jgi:hypothetical protein